MARTRKQKPRTPASGSVRVNETTRVSRAQYEALQKFLRDRLEISSSLRDSQVDVYEYIDREFYAFLLRDAEDQKRLRDATAGVSVKPVDEKLSLIFAQIDEAATYLLSVLAPDSGIYSAIAPREQQAVADGAAALLNHHARFFHHYDNYALFLVDCLRYNLGAYGVFWREHTGNVVQNGLAGPEPIITRQVIETGNEIEAFDPYNLLLDTGVNPVHMAERGEYFATSHVYTRFQLERMVDDGELFNAADYLEAQPTTVYYRTHPEVRAEMPSSQYTMDWVKLFRGGAGNALGLYEINRVFVWLRPKRFGLSDSDDYQIWRFLIGSNHEILFAEHLENAHGFLPINIAVPFRDHANWSTRSMAERLIPYNRFASFQMNMHQRAARKGLYGLTFVDRSTFPALQDKEGLDLAGGVYFGNLNGNDVDIRKRIVQFSSVPDTSNTLTNISAMDDLMQKILPTNILQQVAGLDRATQYQAAATVQGANRRNLKIAKIITSQAMDRGRMMLMYNILQYQQDLEIITDEGELQKISVRELRDTRIEFKIDDGLKGIDKLALQINMKELFAMVVQSQQASAQTDVMALMNYLSTLFGDYTDFNQFKIKTPLDALPAEQRMLAFELLQQFMQQQEGQEPPAGGGAANVPVA